MKTIIKSTDSIFHTRDGVSANYYQLPEFMNGTTIARATFTGEHGQRTIGERPRIYLVTEGQGEFEINTEKTTVQKDDLVVIPPNSTYNLWPINGSISVILIMDLLDISKLPK